MKRFRHIKEKDAKLLVTYAAPILTLVIASITKTDVKGLEGALVDLGYAVIGILGVLGIWANTDKKEDE